MSKKYSVENLYFLNNTTIFKIKSEGFVEKYWNINNNRFIYKSVVDSQWCGHKDYVVIPLEIKKGKIKRFKNEKEAYKWFAKVK